jgi:hypothetical protein
MMLMWTIAATQFAMIFYWLQTQKYAIAAAKTAATAPHPVPAGADPTLCPFLSSSAPSSSGDATDDDDMMNPDEYETVEVPTDTIIVGSPSHATAKLAAQSSFVAGASGAPPIDEDAAIAAAVAAAEAAIDSFVNQLSAKESAAIDSNSNHNSNGSITHAHDE